MEKVPNEVLGMIFHEYTNADLPVWDLVCVSKRWRQVAFRTPSLWNRLLIAPSFHEQRRVWCQQDNMFNSYLGNRHVCLDEMDLDRFTGRCKGTLLDVRIYSGMLDWAYMSAIECLKRLMQPSVVERIEVLNVDVYTEYFMAIWPECFRQAALRNLRILKIPQKLSPQWHTDLLASISASTTNLQVLSMRSGPLSFSDRIWRGIKILDLEGIPKVEMDQVLDKIDALEELKNVPSGWPSTQTPEGALRKPRTISLQIDTFAFRRLHLPSLQNLTIYYSQITGENTEREDTNQLPEVIHLPQLESITLHSSLLAPWLTNILVPELGTLRLIISGSSLNVQHLGSTSIGTFKNLRHLYIQTNDHETVFVPLLGLVPSVVSFTAVAAYWTERFGLSLMSSLTNYEGKFVYGPNIKDLTLGKWNFRVETSKSSLVPVIQQLLAIRKKHNAEFQKVEVVWKDVTEQFVR
ncbi:hypothetical protein CPB86DRAFT_787735 [Serendipita vermifera]|nr:hypothetical protein CPB86DRAFT_787735 [Serendipita vermifera]